MLKLRWRGAFKWIAGFAALAFGLIAVRIVASHSQPTDIVADRVLGQPDFFHNNPNTPDDDALNVPDLVAIDASIIPNRLYISDYGNSRVLGYSSVTSLVSGAPADLVVGQRDLYSTGCNNGGLNSGADPTAATLCNPAGIAVDSAGNLIVADSGNHRVLRFSNPFNAMADTGMTGGFEANWVMGQGGDFTSGMCNLGGNGASDETLCKPYGVAFDAAGDLYVADFRNNRILEYNAPLNTATRADLVFGQQGSFYTGAPNNGGISASGLWGPAGLTVDKSGHLYVADSNNNRVLEYTNPLGKSGTIANAVFGQGGIFSTGGCNNLGLSPSSLCTPNDVKVDGSGNVYIADFTNNRILEYKSPVAANPAASLVFGQDNFGANSCNLSGAPSASTLCGPSGVGIEQSGSTLTLYAVDQTNNRVLGYTAPFGAPPKAQFELGQPDFSHNAANTVDPTAMNNPTGLAIDRSVVPNHLYVADTNNNRILGYESVPSFESGAPADIVIGQPDFYSGACNQNNPYFLPGRSTLCGPGGMSVDSTGNLFVADYTNNRVLEFSAPFKTAFTANQPASLVFGQGGSFGSNGGCVSGISASSLCSPSGTVIDAEGRLYVADYGNNRVLQFVPPFGTKPAAVEVIGQSSFTTSSSGETQNTLRQPTGVGVDSDGNLYVGDTSNNRVLEFDVPILSGAYADTVYGQDGGFTTFPCNSPVLSASTLCSPEGIAFDPSGNLYVADAGNNRVLEYNAPLNGNSTAALVFGQADDFTINACNLGGPPTAFGLCNPAQAAVDSSGDVYIADSKNNRVTEYNAPVVASTPAPTRAPSLTPKPTGTPTATPKDPPVHTPTGTPAHTPTVTRTATPTRTPTPKAT